MVALSPPDFTYFCARSACGPPETRTPHSRTPAIAAVALYAAAARAAAASMAASAGAQLAALLPVRTGALHHSEPTGLVHSHTIRRTPTAVPAPAVAVPAASAAAEPLSTAPPLIRVYLHTHFWVLLGSQGECIGIGVWGALSAAGQGWPSRAVRPSRAQRCTPRRAGSGRPATRRRCASYMPGGAAQPPTASSPAPPAAPQLPPPAQRAGELVINMRVLQGAALHMFHFMHIKQNVQGEFSAPSATGAASAQASA